jgi:copper chaperone
MVREKQASRGSRSVTTTVYEVSGMTCAHCVHAVSEEVGKLVGVHAVDVELSSGKVTVTSSAPLAAGAVAAAVDEAGYELVA